MWKQQMYALKADVPGKVMSWTQQQLSLPLGGGLFASELAVEGLVAALFVQTNHFHAAFPCHQP